MKFVLDILYLKYRVIINLEICKYFFDFQSIVSSRDERKVGDSPTPFLAVACTSEELNKFRIEYEKCHQKAVGMIEEQRPFDENLSAVR